MRFYQIIKTGIFCIGSLFYCYAAPVYAEDRESWFNPLDNLRLAIDLSIRPQFDLKNDHFSHIESVGFDLHKVFSTAEQGDLGTLVVQGYFNKLNNVENPPPFFKEENDLKFVCRICNFNWVVLNKGLLNFRLGHYELPFGLEYNIDTNGTLKQYSNGRDLGSKLDWGVTVNGKTPWLGYEISFSRGAGVDWTSDYRSYIVSGRIEVNDGYSSFLGFSALHGHLKNNNPGSGYIDRTRIGLDGSTQMGPLTLLTEISVGQDNSTDRFNTLIEIDVHDKTEKILLFFQFVNTSRRLKHQRWDTLLQTNLGLSYTLDSYWTLSSQWTQDLEVFQSATPASTLKLQLRYRF